MAAQTVNWELRLELESGLLTRYLQKLAEKTKRGMGEVLREQAPIFGKYIASVTAPMHGYHPGRMTKADHLAGMNAVKYDLLGRRSGEGIVWTAPVGVIRAYRERWGDYQQKGAPKGWERSVTIAAYRDYYDETGARLPEHHRRNRSPRTGRVYRANRLKAEVKRIGTVRVLDALFVPPNVFRRYLKEVQRRVGSIRGGWWRAVQKYGALSGWPAWVQKAAGGRGTTTDRADMPAAPHVILHNMVAYAAHREDTPTALARGAREMRKRLARSVRWKLQNTWN